MRRWALFVGGFLVFIGLVSLVEAIWKIDLGKFFWPLALIIVGIWILVRPPIPHWWNRDSRFVNETNHNSELYARDEIINGFIGDTNLDFSQIILPDGETHYKMNGFVGDIKVRTNDLVGVRVRSHCFVANVNIFGEESTGVMAPADGQTKNYDLAPKKVILDVSYFVCDVKVVKA